MDRAWQIEQEFWENSANGDVRGWFAKYMASDGFIVLPNRVASRDDLISGWKDRPAIRTWTLSEPAFTLMEGGNLVIHYEVGLDAEWLPGYQAFVTSVYMLGLDEWALICRTHTPRGPFPF
ncbi:hypothetical protein LWF15_13410 [Kineosporia rhizophila]|uniref:hypothetical protein n=1 Tax=Kineosporia TaxID=49184 RepID=UPI001E64F287|nr:MULTISPECIES: hypothetical protein [Kineosporia]MCE0536509.1 hypothetical protein [Kineosporia rhizophila]GLY15397.1 hypothetical protein Kisp01_24120 [Kineosporia sp. NBRC 101677]